MPSIVDLHIHGTVELYKRAGCRCDACTAAFMAYVPHGTLSGYTHHGCRCASCREARNAFNRTTDKSTSLDAPPLTVEQIAAAVEAYRSRHNGKYPNRASTDNVGLGGRTWATVESWLRRHEGKTIRTLMGAGMQRMHDDDFEWSEDVIREAAMRFVAEHGGWPTTKSGPSADLAGRTWERAAAWLRQRGKTLAGLRGDDGLGPMTRYAVEPVMTL